MYILPELKRRVSEFSSFSLSPSVPRAVTGSFLSRALSQSRSRSRSLPLAHRLFADILGLSRIPSVIYGISVNNL